MIQTRYAIRTPLPLPFGEAVREVTERLREEGFGVLTEIDVQRTMKEKLGDHCLFAACLDKPYACQRLGKHRA